MALRSARAKSVHRMHVIRKFFKNLVVRNGSPRVGSLEAGVDLLADEGPV